MILSFLFVWKLLHLFAIQFRRFLLLFPCNFSPEVPRLEAEIDRLVYALYNLTDEEIALVEGKA